MLNRDWLPINDPPLTLALLSPSTSFYTGRSVPAGRGFGRARRQSNSGGNLPQVQPRAGQVLHPAGERPPPRAATRSGPRAASGAWADGGGGRCGARTRARPSSTSASDAPMSGPSTLSAPPPELSRTRTRPIPPPRAAVRRAAGYAAARASPHPGRVAGMVCRRRRGSAAIDRPKAAGKRGGGCGAQLPGLEVLAAASRTRRRTLRRRTSGRTAQRQGAHRRRPSHRDDGGLPCRIGRSGRGRRLAARALARAPLDRIAIFAAAKAAGCRVAMTRIKTPQHVL